MNAQFHVDIPDVNVDQVAAGSDPLVIASLLQGGGKGHGLNGR